MIFIKCWMYDKALTKWSFDEYYVYHLASAGNPAVNKSVSFLLRSSGYGKKQIVLSAMLQRLP